MKDISFYSFNINNKSIQIELLHAHVHTLSKLAQNTFKSFLGKDAIVALAKHLDRKNAVSALIDGFLLSRAACMSSISGSNVVCNKYFGYNNLYCNIFHPWI